MQWTASSRATWGAQAIPCVPPSSWQDPAQHPGQPLPIMLPGAAPPAPPPQQHQHLARQNSHAEAHALAAHAAMGSYALAAVQQNGGNSGPPAHPHTARPAMPSRRSSFDGALHALSGVVTLALLWQRRDFLAKARAKCCCLTTDGFCSLPSGYQPHRGMNI